MALGPRSYQVTQAPNSFTTTPPDAPYSVTYGAGCSGVINAGETKTYVVNDVLVPR